MKLDGSLRGTVLGDGIWRPCATPTIYTALLAIPTNCKGIQGIIFGDGSRSCRNVINVYFKKLGMVEGVPLAPRNQLNKSDGARQPRKAG